MATPIDIDRDDVEYIIEMMATAISSRIILDMLRKNKDLESANKEEASKKPSRKIPVRVQKVVEAL